MPGLRSNLRHWWAEMLWAALAATLMIFDHKGGVFLAVFCTVVLGIGWTMGHRHRSLGLHGKLDRMTHMIRDLNREAAGEPRLRLVSKNGDSA